MSGPPPRIVHVVGTLGGGGVQRLILTAAAAPALSGFSHSLICVEGVTGQLRPQFQAAGIDARFCPFLWPSSGEFAPYRASKWVRQQLAWTFSGRLAGAIKALGATIVHSHVSQRIDEQAEAAIGVARVPWVWTIHGMYKPEGSELDRWKRAARTLEGGRGRVMAVSEAIVSDLEARGVRPRGGALLVHGGVDFKAFSGVAPSRESLRDQLQIPKDAVVIGTVGRLTPVKGYDVLVAAAEALVKRRLPIRVLIGGEGRLRPILEAEIKSRGLEGSVSLVGFQSDVRGFLSSLDVYVQSSRSEGFGISLLEALAVGLPCVATDVGGTAELLGGDTGVLVPAEDAGSLAEALERLCSPSVRSSVARNAVEVAARYSIDITAKKWAEIYDEVRDGGERDRLHERRGWRGRPNRIARRLVQRVERRLHDHARWQCAEPLLIFESDDWGLDRRASSERLKAFGRPGPRADEELETVEDMRRLFDVLDGHRDATGRPAAFTANVVVASPDYDAITRDRYEVYREIPISRREDLRLAWREGVERGVFCAELHGRRHFSVEEWMADLRGDVAGARALCSEHRHGGLSLLEGQSQRYHTEYLTWRTGVESDERTLTLELKGSLDILEELSGRRPTSTIAPHYVFFSRIEKAWREAGLRFVQGAHYQVLRGQAGEYGHDSVSHALGERSRSGLLYLSRSVRFEPRPERPHQGIASALAAIRSCFEQGIPAVVDTHRVNFTGRYRDGALHELGELLDALRPLRPLFLTTGELGEAIEHRGRFRDIQTGEERALTPLDPAWRRGLRPVLGGWNARRIANAGARHEAPR
jgi:glycosyltransferase involved in cell wall biosynthesis